MLKRQEKSEIKEKSELTESEKRYINKSRSENYDVRRRLMSKNKYLQSPIFTVALVLVSAVLLMLIFNGVTTGLPQAFKGQDVSILKAMFTFKRAFRWAYGIFMILGAGVGIWFHVSFQLAYSDLDVGQKGTSRWTTREELEEQYRSVPEKTERFSGGGGIPVARSLDGRIYIDDSPVNNLILGISRSGKGEIIVFPTIDIYSRAEKQASMIIADPKLELAAASMETLEKRGYECHVLNLVDPELSMGYNPLTAIIEAYKKGDIADAELLCASLCYSIFNPSSSQGSGDTQFWADNSTALASALILAACEDNIRADKLDNLKRKRAVYEENKRRKMEAFSRLSDEDKALYSLKARIEGILRNEPCLNIEELSYIIFENADEKTAQKIKQAIDSDIVLSYEEVSFTPTFENEKNINLYSIINTFSTLSSQKAPGGKNQLDVYFESRPEGNRARLKYATIGTAGEKTKGSIYSNTLSRLQVFTYENIAKMTAKSTVDLHSVGFGDRPIAIFIGIPDYDRSNHFIATVFIKQLYFTLAKAATHRPSGKCDREVVFLLDEFGNLPAIDDMANIITVCLGRNIRFNLIVQDYEQIDNLYGANAKTIRSNCANHIYIMCNEEDTAESFSRKLGNETYTNLSRSGKRFGISKDFTESEDDRPLLNLNELMNLQEGEMIVARVIKRKDKDGKHVTSYPIASLGEYRMQYRYQYLTDDFPNRTLSDIQNLETIDSINLDDITWSAENYLRRQNVMKKSLADQESEDKATGEAVTIRGALTLAERREVRQTLSLTKSVLEQWVKAEMSITLKSLYDIALSQYQKGNVIKAITLLNIIDAALERNNVKVTKIEFEQSKKHSYGDAFFNQIM